MPGLLHSKLLANAGFRHAFFTREGGVSRGAFASLNFSVTVGDEPFAVEQNLQRAAQALGVQRERLYFPSQVHEAEVVELLGDEAVSDVLQRSADAVVSGAPDLACAVRIADCVPVLMADPLTGRVAAVHAGWRGLVRAVIPATARVLGEDPRGWIAAIGPHITQPAFEVSEDVASEIEAVCPGAACVLRPPNSKPHVSLAAVARWQLEHLGMQPERIEVVAGCTHGDPERFYSFRRDGKASGRHLAAIAPRLSRSDTVRSVNAGAVRVRSTSRIHQAMHQTCLRNIRRRLTPFTTRLSVFGASGARSFRWAFASVSLLQSLSVKHT